MEDLRACEVCNREAKLRCAACQQVFYCSKKHQKQDWKLHKDFCVSYKVSGDEKEGYRLVATRDLSETIVIIDQMPLMWGPKQGNNVVCLGCLGPLDPGRSTNCPKCGWPLCCDGCAVDSRHIPECHYTCRRKNDKILPKFDLVKSHYDIVMVLRCLYQKKAHPDVWEKLMRMRNGGEAIQRTSEHQFVKNGLVEVIQSPVHFGLKDEFTAEEIMKVWSIIQINHHFISVKTALATVLYEADGLLEHNCRANCYTGITHEGTYEVTAGVPIKKGDHLSVSFVYALYSTPNRQRYLRTKQYISCSCTRCKDVTEYGTNLSAYRCQQRDCDGLMLPYTFLHKKCPWVCNICNHKISAAAAIKIFQRIDKDFRKTGVETYEGYITFIKEHQRLLPEYQGYMVSAKLPLLFMIGHCDEGTLSEIPDGDILFKKKESLAIMQVVDIVAPAEIKLKVDLMHQYLDCLKELHSREVGGLQLNDDYISKPKEMSPVITETDKILERQDAIQLEAGKEPDIKQIQKHEEELAKEQEKLHALLISAEHIAKQEQQASTGSPELFQGSDQELVLKQEEEAGAAFPALEPTERSSSSTGAIPKRRGVPLVKKTDLPQTDWKSSHPKEDMGNVVRKFFEEPSIGLLQREQTLNPVSVPEDENESILVSSKTGAIPKRKQFPLRTQKKANTGVPETEIPLEGLNKFDSLLAAAEMISKLENEQETKPETGVPETRLGMSSQEEADLIEENDLVSLLAAMELVSKNEDKALLEESKKTTRNFPETKQTSSSKEELQPEETKELSSCSSKTGAIPKRKKQDVVKTPEKPARAKPEIQQKLSPQKQAPLESRNTLGSLLAAAEMLLQNPEVTIPEEEMAPHMGLPKPEQTVNREEITLEKRKEQIVKRTFKDLPSMQEQSWILPKAEDNQNLVENITSKKEKKLSSDADLLQERVAPTKEMEKDSNLPKTEKKSSSGENLTKQEKKKQSTRLSATEQPQILQEVAVVQKENKKSSDLPKTSKESNPAEKQEEQQPRKSRKKSKSKKGKKSSQTEN